MLRAGRIVYTNDLPVYTAFDTGAMRFPGALVADVPTNLNAALLDGRLDLSPISAFHFAQYAGRFALLPEICIGSRRDVWSVVCVSRDPLAHLGGATIAVTTESASGRNLLRVLLERRYGVRATFETSADPYGAAKQGSPALLIGDRAIDARLNFPSAHVHDLGSEWYAWTGMNMVYAVWAVRRDVLASHSKEVDEALRALVSAQRWGAAHLDVVAAVAQATRPRPSGFYQAYFDTLNFTFDAAARAGLARYFTELHAIGAIGRVPAVDPEVCVAHH